MSSKHDPLTVQEIEEYQLHPNVIKLLKNCSHKFGIPYSSLRVLDWGCGRGMTVIKLLQIGINAYGVDIDPSPINNGLPVMNQLGLNGEKRLFQINPDCKTLFEDGFFHIILSDQVFEHVSDINALTTELSRLTCSQGEGLHIFPAKWRLIEPHLFIPIVHWLPKNRLRSWWIRLMLDRIPVWRGMNDKNIDERIETYYQYILKKTYYRSLSQLKNILRNKQFEVYFYSCASPQSRHRLLFPFLRLNNQFSSKFWNWYVNTFQSVILATKRQ